MGSVATVRGTLRRKFPLKTSLVFRRHKFSARPDGGKRADPFSLPTTPTRTRFAPSPTGYVHIGSLRTALYNYLLAKATGGQFLLRLEDTDQRRLVPDAETRLYDDLKWSGLKWDEGPDVGGPYGPYKQSERLTVYEKYANELISHGRAFRCFCKPEDLDALKQQNIQEGTPPLYPGTCSHIPPDQAARRAANGEEHCVRFRCEGQPSVQDLVYGHYKRPEKEDDFIIIKRDGFPTYHFANVVDDHLMKITHVIRGAEWLISTPRHSALYSAFGWQPPIFAHVGLLVDQNKQKLSKRHGNVDVTSWRDRGYLPEALLNYVMLLGWSGGRGKKKDSDVMDLSQMVAKFSLKFTKGDITVNDKDVYLQSRHIRRLGETLSHDDFATRFLPGLEAEIRAVEELQAARDTGAAESRLGGAAIGPPVPPAGSQPNSDDDLATVPQAHARRFLLFDPPAYQSAPLYLSRHAYLLWQVPEAAHASSFADMRTASATAREAERSRILASTQVADFPHHEDRTNPAEDVFPASLPDGSGFEAKFDQKVVFTDPAELASLFHAKIAAIDDGSWSKDRIQEAIGSDIKQIFSFALKMDAPPPTERPGWPSFDAKEPEPWGYHFLRWVLMASRPGPALIPSMEFLGRQETLRRFEQASRVATK